MTLTGILLYLLLGLIAGWIASIMTKTSSKGFLTDIVLGIVGATIGGLIMNFFGQPAVTGFNLYSLIVAILGATVLIWLGRLTMKA